MKLFLKAGRIIDPVSGKDDTLDILIVDGRIEKIAKNISTDRSFQVMDLKGKIVTPGFIDMHVHLRQPGFEHKETIETGLRAAVKGGFTGVCPMANTQPVADSRSDMEFQIGEARRVNLANLWPVGAVTLRQEGKELTELGELKKGGAIALSDDGQPITDSNILR